ncbi:hypothetical protein KGF57_000003 [Candida theae]|uniref:BHLH domain-containing protein n=1 Tax=Candida theae TaxID=1198502 RepID=A0AAD5BJN2_9ASCO|nr:uncharacterized protein KGF57_000003 [Candida theae]KAI5968888.1 hypothetical protein KGF57_000003 [Candida theae]
MSFPAPPVLKTTIIQLNKKPEAEGSDKNYEILTNTYSNISSSENNTKSPIGGTSDDSAPTSPNLEALGPSKKKRRRSTANIDSEELAKRKHETKQLHSIIEKRRRIKINREFEALKYLIPACRNFNGSTPDANSSSPSKRASNAGSSSSGSGNGNKIDGMYKLTILKSSVEYILYLHHVIQKQQEVIRSGSDSKSATDFNIDFAKVPLDVNQYRNIDVDFNFKTLLNDVEGAGGLATRNHADSSETKLNRSSWIPNHNRIIEEEEEEGEEEAEVEVEVEKQEDAHNSRQSSDGDDNDISSRSSSVAPSLSSVPSQMSISSSSNKLSLPTPEFTPDMAPIFTILNKYADTNMDRKSRKGSYPISPQTFAIRSANPSPFTNPLKSTLSNSSSPSMRNYINKTNFDNAAKGHAFALPDPAINPTNSMPRDRLKGEGAVVVGGATSKPQSLSSSEGDRDEEMGVQDEEELNDQCASKTLLALRKSSIGNLLN